MTTTMKIKGKILVTIHNHRIEEIYGQGQYPSEVWCKCEEFFASYILHADHVATMVFDAIKEVEESEGAD